MSKKILVIRFSSIGDIVLTSPVIRTLHQQLGAEVHFLTKESFAPIMQANPYVTRVISLSEDFEKMIDELREENYNHVVDLHHNVRTKRIKLALGLPSTSFHKLNFKKWILVRFGINRLPETHIVDRYMATVAPLGVPPDDGGLDFFIPLVKEVDIGKEFGIPPGDFVAIVIGAAHQTKCLTADQITRICDLLHKPVILLGGKDEISKATFIASHTTATVIRNACGQFDILQSASILQQSGVVITHDTGLMHIAAALKKPQIVIWGNTVPDFGMYPYYGKENANWISFEVTGLKCRPCTKLGFEECPKGHFKCILDQDTTRIAIAAQSFF